MNEGAMNSRYRELVREFSVSLGVHVRDDGEGGLVDEREERASEMAARDVEEHLLLMGDVPQDLAAIISCGISQVDALRANRIMFLQDGRLTAALQQMQQTGTLPLKAKDGHPVAGILNGLVGTGAGCVLYRDVAVILLRASREESKRVLSFRVVSGSREERALPHSDEEVERGGDAERDDPEAGGDDAESEG